ncbi:protein YpfM [Escherichia coli]
MIERELGNWKDFIGDAANLLI